MILHDRGYSVDVNSLKVLVDLRAEIDEPKKCKGEELAAYCAEISYSGNGC